MQAGVQGRASEGVFAVRRRVSAVSVGDQSLAAACRQRALAGAGRAPFAPYPGPLPGRLRASSAFGLGNSSLRPALSPRRGARRWRRSSAHPRSRRRRGGRPARWRQDARGCRPGDRHGGPLAGRCGAEFLRGRCRHEALAFGLDQPCLARREKAARSLATEGSPAGPG